MHVRVLNFISSPFLFVSNAGQLLASRTAPLLRPCFGRRDVPLMKRNLLRWLRLLVAIKISRLAGQGWTLADIALAEIGR
jgi:hypothetical protein